MIVYLDNNIFISIEDNEIDFENFKGFFSEKPSFVYSYAHIVELLEAKHNLDYLQNRRLNTILNVTNNLYLFPTGDQINFTVENPEDVINAINRYPVLNAVIRNSIENFKVDREQIIEKLGIDKKRINNYAAREVVNHMNAILTNNISIDLSQMIQSAGVMLHEKINSVFNFLDILGYWTDKETHKSDFARVYDATHVFFASGCDYFVSNDKRARNKAKVAYELFDIQTKVVSYEELESNNLKPSA
jgi:hypothetical protein